MVLFTKPTDPVEASKQLAAYSAVDENIRPEHKVIGVGSGSTVIYVVERLSQLGELNNGRIFIPSGFQSRELITKAGLQLGEVEQISSIDVTIDGADEVDDNLQSIKGGGACQFREMILAQFSKKWIIVADYRKEASVLGTQWKQGVPIEIATFGWNATFEAIRKLGSANAVLRMGKAKAGPVVTDNGNFVIDAPFPEEQMKDPVTLRNQIKLLTGVLEVGLFVNMADSAYFGLQDGAVNVRTLKGVRRIEAKSQ